MAQPTSSPGSCCRSPSRLNGSPSLTSAKPATAARSSAAWTDWNTQIAEIAEGAAAVCDEADRQAALLETLDEIDQQIAGLVTRLTQTTARPGPGESNQTDQSTPAPRWWKLDEQGRDVALSRLRAWVEQIYRPCYGHLAAVLGPCWEQHPLCVYGLDWLMELWTALYLTPERKASTLPSQAEWQTRLLPAIAEQLHYETTHCEHDRLTGETQRGGDSERPESEQPHEVTNSETEFAPPRDFGH